ncbi:MAG: DNA-processing protein DprA [Microbacteriaceae bacterium]
MSIIGLSAQRLETLLAPVLVAAESAPVLGDGVGVPIEQHIGEPATPEDIFSKVVWSLLAEPGDGVAGDVVAVLGAKLALEALIQVRNDPVLFFSYLPTELSAELKVRLNEGELQNAIQRWLPRLNQTASERALEHGALLGAKMLCAEGSFWPQGLEDLGRHQPMVLWMRGNPQLLGRVNRSVALVGSRAASGYGEQVAMELATGLDNLGYEILSGGAYGIDGMAHRAALANDSSTTAIFAGGVDRLYPTGHEQLLQGIIRNGLVLAESPPGTSPTKWRFLQRNRLIAALSSATIVIEAGFRSGSLNTAGHAQQLGRALGAVPGPITSASSAGCHRLFREYGAECIVSVETAAELLGASVPGREQQDELLSRDELRVLDGLSSTIGHGLGELAALIGMGLGELQSLLGLLELQGLAIRKQDLWMKP